MSILATQGIAVGDHRHVVFPSTDPPQLIKDVGTHEFIWKALEKWSGSDGAVELLDVIVRPGSIGLRDWFGAADASVSPGSQISEQWFDAWGVDLQLLSSDRAARNEVSYRPSGIVSFPSVGIVEGSGFLSQVWSAFEPSSDAQFPSLDIELLRYGLLRWWEDTTGNQIATANQGERRKYHEFLELILSRVHPVGRSSEEWVSVLESHTGGMQDSLLNRASDQNSRGPGGSFNVLSRAALLLRVAIGGSADLLKHAGVNKSRFDDWLREVALDCGFIDDRHSVDSMSDMWSDVEVDITRLTTDGTLTPPGDSRCSWLRNVAKPGFSLTGIERIGLWGLEQ